MGIPEGPDYAIDMLVTYIVHLGPYRLVKPLQNHHLYHCVDAEPGKDPSPFPGNTTWTHAHLKVTLLALALDMPILSTLAYNEFSKAKRSPVSTSSRR